MTRFDRASITLLIRPPWHPSAALMVSEQLVISLWRCMTGREPMRTVKARVTVNTPSAPGRKTFQLVKLAGDEAEPVFARSGMISPMSAADGYFIMDENQEGVKAGEAVEVFLWE